MEKRTKQMLIGGLIVIALGGALIWFLKAHARFLNCDENPNSPACWHAPDKTAYQK